MKNQKTGQEEMDYFYSLLANPAEAPTPENLDTETGQIIEQMTAFERTTSEISPESLVEPQRRIWQQLVKQFDLEEKTGPVQPHVTRSEQKAFPASPVKAFKLSSKHPWIWSRTILTGMTLITLFGIVALVLLTLVSIKGPAQTRNSGSQSGLTPVPTPTLTSTPKEPLASQLITPSATPTIAPVTSIPAPTFTYSWVTLNGHTGPVTQLSWSPGGKYFATSSDNDSTVRVWKVGDTLQQTALLTALAGHLDGVLSIDWSPDGKFLATGSKDRTVKIWNIPAGTLLKTLETTDSGAVQALTFAPDGQTLAAAYQRNPLNVLVKLWRTADWSVAKTLDSGTNFFQAYNLKWSPDGAFLVGGMTFYKLWRSDGSEVGTANFGAPVWGLAWSPDSKRWAIASESSVIYFYDTTARQLGYLSAGNGDWLAWSPDGKLLASVQYGLTLTKTENQTFSESDILIKTNGPSSGIMAVAWSPDGKTLATGSARNYAYGASAGDNSVILWDRQGRMTGILNGHSGQVNVVAWSPDGKLLASGSEDKTVRLWAVNP